MESARITPFRKQKGLISEPHAMHGKGCFPKQDIITRASRSQASRAFCSTGLCPAKAGSCLYAAVTLPVLSQLGLLVAPHPPSSFLVLQFFT